MNEVYIGPTPADEPCEGSPNLYGTLMRVYRNQLRRMFGKEPEGAALRIKTFNMGEYRDLVVDVEDENRQAMDWALKVEHNTPSKWDLLALVELTAAGYAEYVNNRTRY